MALMSTGISSAIPKPRAIIVPKISIIWTIQDCYIALLKLRSSPFACFDRALTLY